MNDVRVRALGCVDVVVDGGVIPIHRRQLRAVVAVMALEPGSSVLNDRLIDALWTDQPPRRPRHALHVYVNRLRSLHPAIASSVSTVPNGYRLDCAQEQVDLAEFERLARAGRGKLDTAPGEALGLLNDADALWRGPAFGDLHYEEFAAGAVRRLNELRVAAKEDLCDAALRVGSSWDPTPALLELARLHPVRERPIALLLMALQRNGRSNEAAAECLEYHARVTREFEARSSPELTRLMAQLASS